MFCHGAGLSPGRLRRSGGRSQGIAASFPSMVPDAPLPEARSSPAHNARAFRGGARAPACARRRPGPLPECHGMSCFVMGPASVPAVCAGPAVVREALQLPFGSRSRTRPLPEERASPAHNARARLAAARVCARARRAAGAGRSGSIAAGWGRGSVAVIRASLGAKGGTGCPCFARNACGPACAGGRAYRGGAVRARNTSG